MILPINIEKCRCKEKINKMKNKVKCKIKKEEKVKKKKNLFGFPFFSILNLIKNMHMDILIKLSILKLTLI